MKLPWVSRLKLEAAERRCSDLIDRLAQVARRNRRLKKENESAKARLYQLEAQVERLMAECGELKEDNRLLRQRFETLGDNVFRQMGMRPLFHPDEATPAPEPVPEQRGIREVTPRYGTDFGVLRRQAQRAVDEWNERQIDSEKSREREISERLQAIVEAEQAKKQESA